MTTIKYRQLDWRSVTNDKVKYRMRGDIFVTNQMRITFLACYNFNIFQATLRLPFRKVDL